MDIFTRFFEFLFSFFKRFSCDEPDVPDDPDDPDFPWIRKPIIYLYPEKETDVSVKLDYKGKLAVTYPAYNGGWVVTA